MKEKFYKSFISSLMLTFVACSIDAESDKVQDGTQTRINVYPAELFFKADGKTINDENELTAIITVNPLDKRDYKWQAVLKDDSWASISQIKVDNDGIEEKGVIITVNPNSNYRRKTELIVTLDDGTEENFMVEQIGEKADAFIEIENNIDMMEFMADEISSQSFNFITNMDDYKIIIEEGSEWLSYLDLGNNKIEIIPNENTEENAGEREAKIKVYVGSPDTSEDFVVITVKQLAPDIYNFIWGNSLPDYKDVSKASKMEKLEDGIYKIAAYFKNGNLRMGQYAKSDRYPQYYLKDGNQVGLIENSTQENGNNPVPTLNVDGMRTLVINLNTMTYTLDRISTVNSMPDEELLNYPTKEYIARDGTMKEWIVASIRWDGGHIVPKLGGKLIPSAQSASGGYNATADLPQTIYDPKLVPNYEEEDNGGILVGDDTHGRIYAFSEMLIGAPRGGIDGAINQTFPSGWQAGDVVIDAVGNKVEIDYLTAAKVTGNNSIDEINNPTLTWQVQGICPYGYHIANAQDWLDLAYAMSQASQGSNYPVNEDDITYKQFMTTSAPRGITNMAAWLRNNTYWQGNVIADGSDEFGFNYFPTGFRYLKQGWQMYGLRKQVWVPLLSTDTKAFRINVIINNNNNTYAELVNVDNGNAILPFRCVRNYK